MRAQRDLEGECIRAKGPQKKEQLPAAAAMYSDVKDTHKTVRKKTHTHTIKKRKKTQDKAKGVLMLYNACFIIIDKVKKDPEIQI